MNIHDSIIHNNQKLEESKYLWIDKWINKMWYIQSMKYYSAIEKNWGVHICYNMDELWKPYGKWKPVTKDHVEYDCTGM